MTDTETVTSPQNEKLKLVRRLADRRGRERERLFATEGEDLLVAGVAAGMRPVHALVAAGSELDRSGSIAGADRVAVEPALLAEVSALGSGSRVIAVWRLPEADGRRADRGTVYLDAVGDPGNVGTIVRSAAALTGGRVVLGPGCADPWGPKAVRASMGAIFSHPPRAGEVATTPLPRLALVAHGGEEIDAAIAATRPSTLCLGAEREGLGPEVLSACAVRATIPVRAGSESLNVAAAAAIALQRICSAPAAGELPGAGDGDG